MDDDDFSMVVQRLRSYYPQAQMTGWMFVRNALLAGSRPVDLVRQGDTRRVLKIIDRMDSGRL